jgi:hypothetical protein
MQKMTCPTVEKLSSTYTNAAFVIIIAMKIQKKVLAIGKP